MRSQPSTRRSGAAPRWITQQSRTDAKRTQLFFGLAVVQHDMGSLIVKQPYGRHAAAGQPDDQYAQPFQIHIQPLLFAIRYSAQSPARHSMVVAIIYMATTRVSGIPMSSKW